LSTKKAELDLFLHANKTDIAATSKTKLSPNRRFSIPGYTKSDRTQTNLDSHNILAKSLHKDMLLLVAVHSYEIKTFLHILTTLVNLQWDYQLNRTDDFIRFWVADYNGRIHPSRPSMSCSMTAFPHVQWTDVYLQQGNVSSPQLGRCLLLPDFMEAPLRREVLPLPKSPKVVCVLLSHSKFFR
jgi:hypothetical protein